MESRSTQIRTNMQQYYWNHDGAGYALCTDFTHHTLAKFISTEDVKVNMWIGSDTVFKISTAKFTSQHHQASSSLHYENGIYNSKKNETHKPQATGRSLNPTIAVI